MSGSSLPLVHFADFQAGGARRKRFVMRRVCASELSCPADDGLEPNDDLESARDLTEGQTARGIVCAGDDDYYVLWAPPSCILDVELTFVNDDGDLDLELLRQDGSSSSRSAGVADVEALLDVIPDEGPLVIRVYGFGGAENTYRLRASSICSYELVCPADDPFEPNDAREEASRLMSRENTSSGVSRDEATGILCGDDDDYYSFPVTQGCEVEIEALFTHADGDIDVRVQNSGGSTLASGASVTDDETLSYTVEATGTHYIRVYGIGDIQNDYRMRVVQTCP